MVVCGLHGRAEGILVPEEVVRRPVEDQPRNHGGAVAGAPQWQHPSTNLCSKQRARCRGSLGHTPMEIQGSALQGGSRLNLDSGKLPCLPRTRNKRVLYSCLGL